MRRLGDLSVPLALLCGELLVCIRGEEGEVRGGMAKCATGRAGTHARGHAHVHAPVHAHAHARACMRVRACALACACTGACARVCACACPCARTRARERERLVCQRARCVAFSAPGPPKRRVCVAWPLPSLTLCTFCYCGVPRRGAPCRGEPHRGPPRRRAPRRGVPHRGAPFCGVPPHGVRARFVHIVFALCSRWCACVVCVRACTHERASRDPDNPNHTQGMLEGCLEQIKSNLWFKSLLSSVGRACAP